MRPPITHLFRQGPNLLALLDAAWTTVRSRGGAGGAFATPSPELTRRVPAPADALIDDYLGSIDGLEWSDEVPGHLFPYWAFPLMARTLDGLPWDLSRVINAGVNIAFNHPIPRGEPLTVRARVTHADVRSRHVLLTQQIVTDTPHHHDALVAEARLLIPLGKGGRKGPRRSPELVPADAREVARWTLHAGAGWDFALLTGDFNPIHWVPAAGRAAGFGGCILHGFGTLARALEGLAQGVHAGSVHELAQTDVRFVRPVKLPGAIGLFVTDDGRYFVGAAAGAPANLIGTFTSREATP